MVRHSARRFHSVVITRYRALVPAAIALAMCTSPCFGQRYILDDGGIEAYTSHRPSNTTESCSIQGYTVPGGGSDLIRSISVALTPYWYISTGGAPMDGSPIRIAVWDDPNGDLDPSDAVLLSSYAGHVVSNTNTAQFVTYAFPQPVPVSGSFFIGTALPSIAPKSSFGSLDDGEGYRFDSWIVGNASGPLDLANLSQNSNGPHNIFLTGRFLLRANDGDYGAPIGQQSCLAFPNSANRRGRLAATGNLNAMNGDWRVTLVATELPYEVFGFFLASQTQVPPRVPMNSLGRLCLGGQVLRIGPSIASSGFFTIMWDVNLGNVDSYGAAVPGVDVVTAGQTWSFQCWHRDDDPGPTSNLTEAVTVTFQ